MTAWPMIGRDNELRLIHAALAGRATVTGALVSGAAGVGKTRLAQEALGEFDRRATLTLVGTVAAQAIPLAPLLNIFPDITAAPEQGIAAASTRLTGRRPRPVLLVDDAQWLDLSTQSLLHQLVRAREVRVVATVRDDLPVPPTVLDLWKSGHLERIDLNPLGPAESAQLIAAIVGAPVEASVLAHLYGRSQGMPLALRELTAEAVSGGALVVRNGVGRAARTLPPSRRLLDVIAGNLERLD